MGSKIYLPIPPIKRRHFFLLAPYLKTRLTRFLAADNLVPNMSSLNKTRATCSGVMTSPECSRRTVAIANESNYTKDDIRALYVRRFKKDVLQDLKKHALERNVEATEAEVSVAEEQVFEILNELKLGNIDSHRKAGQLFKTTLLKAMLSSPAACLETVTNRLKRLEKKQDLDGSSQQDVAELEELQRHLMVQLRDEVIVCFLPSPTILSLINRGAVS